MTKLKWGAAFLLMAALLAGASPPPAKKPAPSKRREAKLEHDPAHRLWIVFAPSSEDKRFQEQQTRWKPETIGADLNERDLLVITLFETGESKRGETALTAAKVQDYRSYYRIQPGAFAAILVGKDGGEKFRTTKPVSSESVFRRIDAMPMRKEEMKRLHPR